MIKKSETKLTSHSLLFPSPILSPLGKRPRGCPKGGRGRLGEANYEHMKMSYLLLAFLLACAGCGEKQKRNNSLYEYDKDEVVSDVVEKTEGSIRILSYNVRHCAGMDDSIDYERIAGIINAFNPDYVCLQELDSVTTRSAGVNQIELLSEKTGMYAYFGAAINYGGGKYGIGVLSKNPALNTATYGLPGKEKRAFLIAEYPDFLVVSTHLDLEEENRIVSAGIISEKVKSFGKKAFLAGDFNEVSLESETFKEFNRNWKTVSVIKNTFPTGKPDRCIDYILTTDADVQIKKTAVIYSLKDLNVPVASDHYPIFIDF